MHKFYWNIWHHTFFDAHPIAHYSLLFDSSLWREMEHTLLASSMCKPSGRFELPTPGLQDQCSNPWATKAKQLRVRGSNIPSELSPKLFSFTIRAWNLPILFKKVALDVFGTIIQFYPVCIGGYSLVLIKQRDKDVAHAPVAQSVRASYL